MPFFALRSRGWSGHSGTLLIPALGWQRQVDLMSLKPARGYVESLKDKVSKVGWRVCCAAASSALPALSSPVLAQMSEHLSLLGLRLKTRELGLSLERSKKTALLL